MAKSGLRSMKDSAKKPLNYVVKKVLKTLKSLRISGGKRGLLEHSGNFPDIANVLQHIIIVFSNLQVIVGLHLNPQLGIDA